MNKKTAIIVLIIALCAVITVLILGFGLKMLPRHKKIKAPTVTGSVTAVFIKVGKADAIVITSEKHTIVVDTGERSDGSRIIDYLEKNDRRKIDYLIISHFDNDHIGGAEKLVSEIPVDKVFQPDYTPEGDSVFDAYSKAMSDNGIDPVTISADTRFVLDDAVFSIYAPYKAYESANDQSLVVSICHGSNAILLTGDITHQRISDLLSKQNLESTLLKIPNHGQLTSNTSDLINAVSPKHAVICSDSETYDKTIIDELEKIGTQTYVTCNGTVVCTSNGREMTAKQ